MNEWVYLAKAKFKKAKLKPELISSIITNTISQSLYNDAYIESLLSVSGHKIKAHNLINKLMVWDRTDEGFDFWNKLHAQLAHHGEAQGDYKFCV